MLLSMSQHIDFSELLVNLELRADLLVMARVCCCSNLMPWLDEIWLEA
jgi:hypothetical protein